jgi:hypothetical protein
MYHSTMSDKLEAGHCVEFTRQKSAPQSNGTCGTLVKFHDEGSLERSLRRRWRGHCCKIGKSSHPCESGLTKVAYIPAYTIHSWPPSSAYRQVEHYRYFQYQRRYAENSLSARTRLALGFRTLASKLRASSYACSRETVRRFSMTGITR